MEDDLYGDLVTSAGDAGAGLLKEKVAELEERAAAQAAQLTALTTQVAELTAERDSLAQENTVLKTNISSLFRTAQLEMQRKQAEIAELRRRASSAAQAKPALPAPLPGPPPLPVPVSAGY